MLNVIDTLAKFNCIPKRLLPVVAGYIFFLTLITKRHSFRAASVVVGLHESRFCTLLKDPMTPQLSKQILSRAVRRRLKRIKRVGGKIVVIIDSTLKARKSKNVQNVQRYHHGSGFALGHKFVNFVVLCEDGIIPLESLPVFTKKYCKQERIKHFTEHAIVESWIKEKAKDYFTESQLPELLFLLDSGFDAKKVQHAIMDVGANFVMSLKSNRIINGKQVSTFFNDKRRWLPWTSIRLQVGSGQGKSRRRYSVRTATDAHLKGFGNVTVVCSRSESTRRRSMKYLATSDLEMTARQIVYWYAKRWSVETWHREIKQNYGFGDCHAQMFSAQESHVNFVLTAYVLQKQSRKNQFRIEEYMRVKDLEVIKRELTKFGSGVRLKTFVSEALQAVAA